VIGWGRAAEFFVRMETVSLVSFVLAAVGGAWGGRWVTYGYRHQQGARRERERKVGNGRT
jgi:hypothetical protein